uniref:Cytochrome P450 n=1 Tax=Coccidioides posadasii RMSCC 3488 TaxID=454284 RepID=A0A0J6F958_COCPO|nr:hypothetical protein CPAG_03061 [Coccidioides posadasii RMSCC 3488]
MGKAKPPKFGSGRKATLLSTINQSLSFHASPELFLSTAPGAADETRDQSNALPSIVRAKILNRDVAVISSYRHCRDILQATHGASLSPTEPGSVARDGGDPITPSTFTVGPAYRELMSDFFPLPNLLLLDLPGHSQAKLHWEEHFARVFAQIPNLIRDTVVDHLTTWSHGSTVDLYEQMKDLSWKFLCAVFLGLSPGDDQYRTIISLQEDLMRGQFSLFPVSINTPLWRSPRCKGIEARKKLQVVLGEMMTTRTADGNPTCPFAQPSDSDGGLNSEELAGNTLLFTSSIAIKALASLLTASLLNLFLFPSQPPLASMVRRKHAHGETHEDSDLLRSILLETERLSPPVIGVMRRVERDVVLTECATDPALQHQVVVPAGWDAWLYFVSASRDASIYQNASQFIPDRFLSQLEPSPPLAFGAGAKACLGREVTRTVVKTVASAMLETGIDLVGSIDQKGVRGWLGWDDNVSVDIIAKELKQLPCQRPREPIRVRVVRGE